MVSVDVKHHHVYLLTYVVQSQATRLLLSAGPPSRSSDKPWLLFLSLPPSLQNSGKRPPASLFFFFFLIRVLQYARVCVCVCVCVCEITTFNVSFTKTISHSCIVASPTVEVLSSSDFNWSLRDWENNTSLKGARNWQVKLNKERNGQNTHMVFPEHLDPTLN